MRPSCATSFVPPFDFLTHSIHKHRGDIVRGVDGKPVQGEEVLPAMLANDEPGECPEFIRAPLGATTRFPHEQWAIESARHKPSRIAGMACAGRDTHLRVSVN